LKKNYLDLYQQFFIDKGDERRELFKIIAEEFNVKKGLYPGSFVHITPFFFIPEMVYVDMDKRCKKFFADPGLEDLIGSNQAYDFPPVYHFYSADFSNPINEQENSFDLLISLYAGFISQSCQRYLKKEGILLANNSHGDSSLAYLDQNFKLIGVVKRNNEKFSITTKELDSYFVPKSGKKISRKEIEKSMRGPGFTKTAYAYLFCKLL